MKNSAQLMMVFVFLLSSCLGEIEKYSPIPEVWFKEYRYFDSTLVIGFIDGDGDIGFSINDTINTSSLFLEYYLLNNSDTVLYESENDSIDFAIPFLETPTGNNKTLKGDIEVNIGQDFLINPEPIDSFLIRFYLIDRSLNESNADTTPKLYAYPPM